MTASTIISIISFFMSLIALFISIRSIYMSTLLMGAFDRQLDSLKQLIEKIEKVF